MKNIPSRRLRVTVGVDINVILLVMGTCYSNFFYNNKICNMESIHIIRGKYLYNIYGALHYTNSDHDLWSLASTIKRYIQSRLCARRHHEIALDPGVYMLLDMTSANGLAPLQYWEKEKIDIYFKIADESTQQITPIDRNVYNFIELTPNKSGFSTYYSIWAFKKMAKNILYVTCRSKYQNSGKTHVVISVYNIYTKRSIQEKQEKYDRYVECVNKRSASIEKWGIQRSYKAVIFQRFANIKLECFQCLSPEDEENIEDIWKPNDSFIARTIQFITEKFKTFVTKYSNKDQISIKFVWEHLKMDSTSDWELVIPEYGKSSSSPTEKARRVVQSFLNRAKSTKEEIGNLFEIEIFKSEHFKHSGFYRCLRTTSKNKLEYVEKKIEQLYFVDIFTSIFVEIRESNEKEEMGKKNLPKLPQFSSETDLIEAKWQISEWGECNRCGKNILGEQRRKIECVVEPKIGTTVSQLANSDVAFLTMFENVPCLSSLLPLRYRQKFQSIKNIEEFRSCQSICLLPNDETRTVKDIDDSGKEFIADELPPNEYSILERLPPLRSSVIRKTVRGNEGDNLVLDCGHNNGDIFWRRDFKDLYSKDLLSEDSTTNFRKYINSDGQLIFQKLDSSDAGFYSCFTTPNILQRTFKVYINKINKTEEIIMYIKIIIRYFTGFLIAILILRTILKTNATAEYRHRSATTKATPPTTIKKE